jgi:hypothetical protein
MGTTESASPKQDDKPNTNEAPKVSYAMNGCTWILSVPALILLIALLVSNDWISHTLLARLWPFLTVFLALVLAPHAIAVARNVRKTKNIIRMS